MGHWPRGWRGMVRRGRVQEILGMAFPHAVPTLSIPRLPSRPACLVRSPEQLRKAFSFSCPSSVTPYTQTCPKVLFLGFFFFLFLVAIHGNTHIPKPHFQPQHYLHTQILWSSIHKFSPHFTTETHTHSWCNKEFLNQEQRLPT